MDVFAAVAFRQEGSGDFGVIARIFEAGHSPATAEIRTDPDVIDACDAKRMEHVSEGIGERRAWHGPAPVPAACA
jgi:hypothetical protein